MTKIRILAGLRPGELVEGGDQHLGHEPAPVVTEALLDRGRGLAARRPTGAGAHLATARGSPETALAASANAAINCGS